jgi:hypothetical protein
VETTRQYFYVYLRWLYCVRGTRHLANAPSYLPYARAQKHEGIDFSTDGGASLG